MLKILTVFGTRPEAIKMAPIINSLRNIANVDSRVCTTGQHTTMLADVLTIFSIVPEYQLNVMRPNQTLTDITVNVLQGVQTVLQEFKPDVILVHGDTTTSFAASLAAFYEKISVAHIEAGLRSHNKYNPWPEEMNRRLTGTIACKHYAPTEQAKQNLISENIHADTILVTGNTVIDTLLETAKTLNTDEYFNQLIEKQFPTLNFKKKLVLVTAHRRENFGNGLQNICSALKQLAERQDIQILFPVHLNPNVQREVHSLLDHLPNIILTTPLNYPTFVYLMQKSYLILTDSGGIQEEAPAFGKPVLIMRDNSERMEAVDAGVANLVGTNPNKILNAAHSLLDDEKNYQKMSLAKNPFGDGKASQLIINDLIKINK